MTRANAESGRCTRYPPRGLQTQPSRCRRRRRRGARGGSRRGHRSRRRGARSRGASSGGCGRAWSGTGQAAARSSAWSTTGSARAGRGCLRGLRARGHHFDRSHRGALRARRGEAAHPAPVPASGQPGRFPGSGPAAMSDYLAVGGVSAVLCSLLTTALASGGPTTILGPTPGITAISPDLITTGPNEQPQLNLFMYYVSLNPALRNLDLPSSRRAGRAGSATRRSRSTCTTWSPRTAAPSSTRKSSWRGRCRSSMTRRSCRARPSRPRSTRLAQQQPADHGGVADRRQHAGRAGRAHPDHAGGADRTRRSTGCGPRSRRPTGRPPRSRYPVVVIQDTQPFTSNLPVRPGPSRHCRCRRRSSPASRRS